MYILYAHRYTILHSISEEFGPVESNWGSQIKNSCVPAFVLALEDASGDLGK